MVRHPGNPKVILHQVFLLSRDGKLGDLVGNITPFITHGLKSGGFLLLERGDLFLLLFNCIH